MVPSAVPSHTNLTSPESLVSVGKLLRAARESQNRAVVDIAEELCLMQRYLHAIEDDDLKNLPAGTFFYRSFVRQYATLLGVNLEGLMPAVDAMTRGANAEPDAPAHAAQEPAAEPAPVRTLDPLVEAVNQSYLSRLGMRWPVSLLILALVGCSGVYAWWNGSSDATIPAAATVHQAPDPAPSAVVAPAVSAELPAAGADATGLSNGDAIPETKKSGPPPAPVASVVPTSESSVELSLSATEQTWLSITSSGHQIFSGVLHASESKTVSGVEKATLRIGNAGGVEIRWNGKSLGPIGGRGEVRTVLLTPGNFEILSPSKTL